jgi:phytoene dehydrogenase-like protein
MVSEYKFWRDLRVFNKRRYKEEQARIADEVAAILDQRYPGFASQIEMCDVATPISFERYTRNWQGSWMGFMHTPDTMNLHIPKSLPDLDGFYIAGSWVMQSGLSFAATSGRHVIQIICDKDEKEFVTSTP